jgi:hypothetical protein
MNNLRASRREAASRAPRMSIVYRAIDQLKPDPANPRRHSKKQIRQIANSIEAFGLMFRCWSMPSSTSSAGTVDYSHVANSVGPRCRPFASIT